MRLALSVVLLAAACNGDNAKDGPATTDSGTVEPPGPLVYQATAPARTYLASLTEDTVAAHQMSNMFIGAVGVVVSDEKAQDRLVTNGNGTTGGGGSGFECWTRPEFPMWTFDLNYEGCEDQGFDMGGGVSVEDHASGPLLFTFNTFQIEDRVLGGTFALDTRGAVPDPLFWVSYTTDGDQPSRDNPVPMGSTVEGSTSGVTWLGGNSVNFSEGTWSTWGVLTLRPADRDFVIIHGGDSADDVPVDQPPGADALKVDLNWQSCRCPNAGISTYDLDLQFDTITVDLDDLEVEPDDIDDPEVTLDVDHVVSGRATIRYLDTCGDFDVDYEVTDTVITVPTVTMTAATSYLCDIKVIEDPTRCSAVLNALSLAGDIAVQVPQTDVLATAQTTVTNSFDGAWCEPF